MKRILNYIRRNAEQVLVGVMIGIVVAYLILVFAIAIYITIKSTL